MYTHIYTNYMLYMFSMSLCTITYKIFLYLQYTVYILYIIQGIYVYMCNVCIFM